MVRIKARYDPGAPDDAEQVENVGGPRHAEWAPEFILSGLALILPAVAFTVAAFGFYPPRPPWLPSHWPSLAGLGLVLLGFVTGRRL